MVVTPSNIREVCARIKEERHRGLDTETTGLEYFDLPFAVIIAIEGEVFYFDERSCPNFWECPEFISLFDDDSTWIFTNAKFDMSMIDRKISKVPKNVHDIAVTARILRNDHMLYSLDAQAKREGMSKLGDTLKDHMVYETRKNYFGEEYKVPRYDKVNFDIMSKYAETDAVITRELGLRYVSRLDEGDRRVFEMECLLTPVLYQMEKTGVVVDKSYTLQALYYEQEIVDNCIKAYKTATGNSFVDSAVSIQKNLSFKLPTTPKGSPSCTSDIIKSLLSSDIPEKDKHLLELVSTIRHHEKRISTYYKAFLNKIDDKGILHPTFWQAGTRTGRMSASDPNVQQLSKEENSTEPYVIRGCIVPRQGNVFVSLDYAQMEYRMMAAYANETSIIRRVMEGEDFHQVAAELFGESRTRAKTLNFMVLYGGGIDKLSNMLKISTAEARNLKNKYFMAMPRVERFIDSVIRTGKSRGYVHNWLGRKMYADFEHCYALPNHLIQGGGADVVKTAMVRIHQEMPHLKMVLQIHDQLVFDMSPDEFKYIPRIKEIMETVWEKNGMTLAVDVSWSHKSLAERDMQKGIPCS